MCKLTLFGAPVLECNGRPQHISRRKARALLAYLAATGQRHTRESLVALLWPEYGQQEGRADLSRMLSALRISLGADYFLTDRESVALNEDADLWVDVNHFRRLLDACRDSAATDLDDDCRLKLAAAADLYQADFLAGFTLPDCRPFDEWQRLQTEALRRDLSWALEQLVAVCESDDDLSQTIDYAQRWVALDPLHEHAQRRLIALYARNGQRSAAHRQYQACERVLAEELGVDPQPETKQLYEQIRSGSAQSPAVARRLQLLQGAKDFPFEWPEPRPKRRRPFVERNSELAQLDNYLDEALAGNGRIVFVTGDAGRGKTSLLAEFARRALSAHPNLIVAGGNGNAFAGAGDPFLPFREVLRLLTGDVAPQSAVGEVSHEQARRLWAVLPETVQAILEHGPQLLHVFLSGKRLLARATTAAPVGAEWLVALQAGVARRREAPGKLEQAALFGQFTNVLHHLAEQRPLLITLDDLQWVDDASVGLLFHLGRRLTGSRILIVGAYRPEELVRGLSGDPHPVLQVLDEFRRRHGDIIIDLARPDETRERAFVEALLDTEPNRLDSAFRQALFQQTRGHPLFTVELLRDMQNRGDLVQNKAGQWRVGQELNWETIPSRVEAVIARRIDRLDDASREILSVASVEGERFTAEVIGRVLGLEKRPLLRTLSNQLERQHRLVQERGEVDVGTKYLSSYRFNHVLFQLYLYQQLPSGERRHLHREVAGALAELYADDLDQIAVQLANHYSAAAAWEQAVAYRNRAGDLAYQRASLREAARHYQSALEYRPETDEVGRAATLRKRGECLWMLGRHREAIEALETSRDLSDRAGHKEGAAAAQRLLGRVHWETGQTDKAGLYFQQAVATLEDETESEELAWALAGMSNYRMHLGDYEASIRVGERALAMARRLGIDALIIQCLCDLGSALSSMGDWTGVDMERESLDRALTLNRPHDAGRAYLYIAEALIYLGRYQEARNTLDEALEHARRMHLPYVAAGVRRQLAELDWFAGRWSAALSKLHSTGDAAVVAQPGKRIRSYLAVTLGRVYNDLGQAEVAHKRLSEESGAPFNSLDPGVAFMGELARAEMMSNRPAEAVAAAAEMLEWTDQVRYLYPNVDLALLFICRAPVIFDHPAMASYARSAWQQLDRLDKQYRTPVTAACRLEGQGWLLLAEADTAKATSAFEQAVAQWQTLDRPYDHARALSGLSRALIREGDDEKARTASERAMSLIDTLAAQLQDPALKTSFLASPLARQIREGSDE